MDQKFECKLPYLEILPNKVIYACKDNKHYILNQEAKAWEEISEAEMIKIITSAYSGD